MDYIGLSHEVDWTQGDKNHFPQCRAAYTLVLCIFVAAPIQDFLGYDTARMNIPGVPEGNGDFVYRPAH